ncbi:MAG: signal recognition particle-docking protein FtsY, partial [Ignavibacteriales bacterium]|nr:signal recognition particle-docking protein FtsY [Ignavibacteriales bacterium]
MGFFDAFKLSRLKEGLAKTRDNIIGKVQKILTSKTKIDEEVLQSIEEALIAGDVGVETSMKILERIRERVKKEGYQETSQLNSLIREEIQSLFMNGAATDDEPFVIPSNHKPHVIMIVGVNGVGKTTTIGKLAYNYKNAGKNVVIAAADTFRAAANEQLEIWAKRAGVAIIQQQHGADQESVAFDALKSAQSQNADVMIIDTAGRLHTKINLMEELKKISRVLQKLDTSAPHEVYLVLDATTGLNAIQQAKQFSAAAAVTGLVLTKLDGTAKGGVVLGISQEMNLPVKYIGVGERIDDLQPFNRKAFV